MSDTVAGLLGRAREAFEQHAHEAVLQRLLETWRKTPAERIAVLAERLSALTAAGAFSHVGRLGQARRLEALVKAAGPGDEQAVARALDELLGEPADPRLTPALLQLAALPLVHEEPRLGRRVRNVLGHVKDPRALGPLRALYENHFRGGPLESLFETLIAFLEEQPVSVLDAEASALCDALEEAIARRAEALARSGNLRETLHARVLDCPDDDGARLVLADHLLDLGDPLGEFIMLQCQPQPDKAGAAALLEKHRATWEGVLGPGVVPGDTYFERGFPHAVRMLVRPWNRLPPPGPCWRTVREMDWSWTGDEAAADWLAHPPLSGVTVLWQVHPTMAMRLGRHPLPVRRLESCVDPGRDPRELFASLEALPYLAEFELVCRQHGQELALYAESPLAARMERFDAFSPESWSLTVVPSAEVPVEATVMSEAGALCLLRVLGYVAPLGARALRIHVQRRLHADIARQLERAASAYGRIEWNLRPG